MANTKTTQMTLPPAYKEAARRKAMAEALEQRAQAPREFGTMNTGQALGLGIAQLGEALIARREANRARSAQEMADAQTRTQTTQAIQQLGAARGAGPEFVPGMEAAMAGMDPLQANQQVAQALSARLLRDPKYIPVGTGDATLFVDEYNPSNVAARHEINASPESRLSFESSLYGTDSQADTARRGQDIGAATADRQIGATLAGHDNAARGQDINLQIARERIAADRAAAAADAAAKAGKAGAEQDKAKGAARANIENATRVMSEIDQAMKDSGYFNTGLIGKARAAVIPASGAAALKDRVAIVVSNLTTDKMQQMRAISPTGSTGLGQITHRELDMLEKAIAALNTERSEKALDENLAKAWHHYDNWRRAIAQEYGIDVDAVEAGMVQPGNAVDEYNKRKKGQQAAPTYSRGASGNYSDPLDDMVGGVLGR
jgi:hypothetical protein